MRHSVKTRAESVHCKTHTGIDKPWHFSISVRGGRGFAHLQSRDGAFRVNGERVNFLGGNQGKTYRLSQAGPGEEARPVVVVAVVAEDAGHRRTLRRTAAPGGSRTAPPDAPQLWWRR